MAEPSTPEHPTAHARRAGSWRARATARRFGARAVALAGALALVGGVGAAAVVQGPVRGLTLDGRGVLTQETEPGGSDGASAGTDDVGTLAAAQDATSSAVHPRLLTGLSAVGPVAPAGASASPTPSPEASEPPEPSAGPDGLSEADLAAGLLSLEVPAAAEGRLVVVPGEEPAPDAGRPATPVRVEVEAGLDVDGALFARMVMNTLNDPRSWGADGSVSFARTAGEAPIRVVLASPRLVDEMCAPLRTGGIYSCGRYGHAALNYMRWVQGADEFTDMTQYRQYLVNHEVGHLLGKPHVGCPAAGELAPVMQQQTIQVAPCVPNGWPFPG